MSDFTAAKRGDLVSIQRTTSSTMMHGPTSRTTVYCLAKVTSVTRDGRVKGAERPQSAPWPWKFGAPDKCLVLSAGRLTKDAGAVAADLGRDFSSLDELKAALRPFVAS